VNSIYEFIRRFSTLIAGLSDNAAFVALLATYPNIKPQHLIMLHLVAMVAKSIYLKGNKVVKHKEDKEMPLPIERKTPAPANKYVFGNLKPTDLFNLGDERILMKCKSEHNYYVDLTTGDFGRAENNTPVFPVKAKLVVE
jgi:hypothetical protein